MRHAGKISIAATLVLAIATPALAGASATSPSLRKAMLVKQKACKKEASEQAFGIHLMKKRTFIKECMARV
jgi:hypothetical protein